MVVIRPGTDAALALGMMHVIVAEGLEDRAFIEEHTVGFEQLAASLGQYTPEWTAEVTGLDAETVRWLARLYATSKPATYRPGRRLDVQAPGRLAGEPGHLLPAGPDRPVRHLRRRARAAASRRHPRRRPGRHHGREAAPARRRTSRATCPRWRGRCGTGGSTSCCCSGRTACRASPTRTGWRPAWTGSARSSATTCSTPRRPAATPTSSCRAPPGWRRSA